MPKPGYDKIIVKKELRERLETIARAEGFRTINQLLEALLKVHPYIAGVNPRVHPETVPNQQIPAFITERILSPVSQNKQDFLVRPPGFEPGIAGLEGLCPNQARRRPHSVYVVSLFNGVN